MQRPLPKYGWGLFMFSQTQRPLPKYGWGLFTYRE